MKARYRDNYSATRLREVARRHRTDERHDDLWRSMKVTFDVLAGRRSGLDLVALDGLFAQDSCPNLDRAEISNSAVAEAVLQLSNVRVAKHVRRVNYRDIGAEELGGVYEGLLDRQPRVTVDAPPGEQFKLIGSGERKSTGSYYTPDSLVQELIKSALAPVIDERLAAAGKSRERQAEALLSITVCDTACGSGHFLLAAARRLGAELARIRADDREPSPKDIRTAQREVVRRCIYGVDVSPLSVDLCRLSLWMESYDSGRPLSFLDHHIKVGNSLIGADPELVMDGLPDDALDPVGDDDKELSKRLKKRNRAERPKKSGESQGAYLSGTGGLLVDWSTLSVDLADEVAAIDRLPELAAQDVDAMRERYAQYVLQQVDPLRERLDAWTAAFFWRLGSNEPSAPTTNDLRTDAQGRSIGLNEAQRKEVRRLAERHRFFHWQLEFPEVFERGGFDCVLGNPPWDRIKLQEQEFFAERDPEIARAPNKAARERLIKALSSSADGRSLYEDFQAAKRAAESASKFVRESGRFPLTAVGDVNLYPLFAEQDRTIVNEHGRAGVIVPTGIATDDSTKAFFQDVVENGALATLFDFENRKVFFTEVHASYKFCTLTLSSASIERGDLAFFLTSTDQLRDERRRFQLSVDDFALVNPNTRTCPIFRTGIDADLTRAIYRRVPVLVDERRGWNPWGVEFLAMFHMSNDSDLFRDAPGPGQVPLYEAKLFHQFNHRWATYDGKDARDATPMDLTDPTWTVRPRYWVEQREVEARLCDRWGRGWLLAFRDIARATDERTAIFGVSPRVGVGHTAPLLFPQAGTLQTAALLGNLSSFVFDYVVRQKVGGTHLTYTYLHQFAVLPPSAYTSDELDFIVHRVLELTYTAWDLKPFAEDLDYDGPPFRWDEDRRALLRAELDAYYAALYGLTRDELRYVLDPQDVYGPDFPGETFRVLKEREIRQLGEYRTRRLVLEAWDRLDLAPRNRDGRYDSGPPSGAVNGVAPRKAETAPGARSLPTESAQILSHQTVRERSRTPARAMPLLPSSSAPSAAPQTILPAIPATSQASGGETYGHPPSPPGQAALPGFSGGTAELRRRVLKLALEALRRSGALTGREIAGRLANIDRRIDRQLVNSVLSREGAAFVAHDAISGKYSAKTR